jgi:hypothetical protein
MRAARNCPASDSSRIWEANYEDSSLRGYSRGLSEQKLNLVRKILFLSRSLSNRPYFQQRLGDQASFWPQGRPRVRSVFPCWLLWLLIRNRRATISLIARPQSHTQYCGRSNAYFIGLIRDAASTPLGKPSAITRERMSRFVENRPRFLTNWRRRTVRLPALPAGFCQTNPSLRILCLQLQNTNFAASWIRRGLLSCEVTVPNPLELPETKFVPGNPNWG